MKLKRLSVFLILIASSLFSEQLGHQNSSTSYGKESVLAYSAHRHGPDGSVFLDPNFLCYLKDLEGKKVLDAGCGAAPWSIYAAASGARVQGIDIQEKMIEVGREAIHAANLDDQVVLSLGDVAQLPYDSEQFDLALSINVGCNLPSTQNHVGLGPHVQEMARTLKKGGMAIVTAPASFGTVFADGTAQEDVLKHISDVLNLVPSNPQASDIIANLNQLKEVYRATFAIKEEHLVLITNEAELVPGENIWRKLPGLTVPNRYHPEEEYLQEFATAGLTVMESLHPQFADQDEYDSYQATGSKPLGEEYISHNPFVIFCVQK